MRTLLRPAIPSPRALILTLLCALLCATFLAGTTVAGAAEVFRKPFEDGVTIVVENGRALYIECKAPRGISKSKFLKRYLADENGWKKYRKFKIVPIRFDDLKPDAQRRVIEVLFPEDYADTTGWWHTYTHDEVGGLESWWNMAIWLTGHGLNANLLESMPENQNYKGAVQKGQTLFIPAELLKDVFKQPSPGHRERIDFVRGDLRYGSDTQGPYAAYRLKEGEAIYVDVINRFTNFHEEAAADAAVERVLKRNDIPDPKRIPVGREIRIPQDMLSTRYQPGFRPSGLEGVVVILDPGHGGEDPGKTHDPVYEDEITYDIVLRIKQELEALTKARVHLTMLDPSQGETPTNATTFEHDQDEVVLTTPPYPPTNRDVSVVLRMYLINDLLRREVQAGIKPENVLVTSIHCDSLPATMFGTMVYIPGASYREDVESPENPIYDEFEEARGYRTITMTAEERLRDEAKSRTFAETLLTSLQGQKPPIATSSTGNPIRDVIIKSKTSRYIPGVIRNAKVPTRVLVETANVDNPDDRANLCNPRWRQSYAEAYVRAVQQYFGH